MTRLPPLESLFDRQSGRDIRLPPELAAVYGRIAFPSNTGQPYVIANFVTTLDGVASLGIAGQAGGGPISGFNPHDRMVMGLLRAMADAVVVGAGTLRSVPNHIWTAEFACPALAESYAALRRSLGKPPWPLNVIVTARGEIDPRLPVFQSGVPVLIVTNEAGATRLRALAFAPSVKVIATQDPGRLKPQSVLAAVSDPQAAEVVLVEGGPHLLAAFFADSSVDEQFLTLAPQVAGRDDSGRRPGMVAGRLFAPEHPLWAKLISVKRGGDHLFVRYAFARAN
jgi:riboflavin biosynthesis pyrimidine reductase